MRYEIKIVNRAAAAMKKFRAADRASMRFVRERAIFLPFSRKHPVAVHDAFSPFSLSLSLFFFFHESVKRAQFRRGIFIGVDSFALYPFVTVPSAFCREFFIQTMLKYILCTQCNTAKNTVYTRIPKNFLYFSTRL